MSEQILKLPEAGQKVVDSYLKMSIGNKIITCPYFTNLQKFRAGLRVFLGKATAEEIIKEVDFIAQKEQANLIKFSEKDLYRFLADHNLGIDCSGLAVYILRALYQKTPKESKLPTGQAKKIDILKKIKIISFFKNPWRYFISCLRPVENINVRVLAGDKNSFQIDSLNQAQAGDMLIRTNLKHIYLITEIEKENNLVKKISYVHAPRPRQKDYFGPGVFQETVTLERGTLKELSEKIPARLAKQGEAGGNNQIIIRRLKF
ncbi:hypothetical protein ISS21_02565 [Patescibacteria group bacterium]|nr:hypothetical protein [Patescibacteria group bacterium]